MLLLLSDGRGDGVGECKNASDRAVCVRVVGEEVVVGILGALGDVRLLSSLLGATMSVA